MVDRLVDELGRSVVVNDSAVVMLYSSRHFGDEDPVRVEAMLNRVAGAAATRHVLAQDVARWTRPARIPAKPEIGMRARHCVPLRWHGDLLGLLMVIDAEVALRHAVLGARRAGLATVAGTTAAVVRFGGPDAAATPLAGQMVAAADELAAGRFTCAAGVGPRVATVAEAWVSHRHAALATRAVPLLRPGPVVDAAGLGAFDLLLRLPADSGAIFDVGVLLGLGAAVAGPESAKATADFVHSMFPATPTPSCWPS